MLRISLSLSDLNQFEFATVFNGLDLFFVGLHFSYFHDEILARVASTIERIDFF